MKLPPYYNPRTPPFEHQRLALEAGYHREFFAYLLEMGLGKSRVTIDDFCINHVGGEVDGLLIVAPKSVYTNWTRQDDTNPGELQKWMWSDVYPTAAIHAYRAGKTRADYPKRLEVLDAVRPGVRILAMNAEALSQTTEAEEFASRFLRQHKCMMVIDESTLIKNPKSRRTKVILRLGKLARMRRILTGSLVSGSPSDAWAQFEYLKPGSLGYHFFTSFQNRYCIMKEIHLGSRKVRTEAGVQNLDELAENVRRHSFRRTKKECLDLPDKLYLPLVEVPLTDDQKRAYKEMQKQAMTVVDGSEVTTSVVITQLLRLHQIVCGHINADDGRIIKLSSNRVSYLEEVLDYNPKAKVVIWCNFKPDVEDVVTMLRKRAGPGRVSEWHGGIPQQIREDGEKKFQNGDADYMVATQSSGARGRTWTAADLVVYYSNNHDLELREQSEDRTHRIGTVGTIPYIDFVSPGTVEVKMVQSLREKKSISEQIRSDPPSEWIKPLRED